MQIGKHDKGCHRSLRKSKQKQGILRILSNADNQHLAEYRRMQASIRKNRNKFT